MSTPVSQPLYVSICSQSPRSSSSGSCSAGSGSVRASFVRLFALCMVVALISPLMMFSSTPPPAKLTVTGNFPTGVATLPYTGSATASGGTAPYTYNGVTLPKGLVLNKTTGVLTGTVALAGTYAFQIFAKDSVGASGSGSFSVIFTQPSVTITVAPKTLMILSGGTQQFLPTVSNTTNTAVTWAVTGGTISTTGSFTAPKVTATTKITLTVTSVADTTKTATATITVSTAPAPKVAMELLFPPTNVTQAYYQDVQTYLLKNPTVGGVDFWLEWASVDSGPGTNPQYNFAAFDAEIAPWIGAGKKVNIIVWPVADLPTNTSTPQYVWNALGSANITTCAGEQIPNYFDSAFQVPYRAFMAQVVQHYAGNGSIGYIRMGLARGGETFPAQGFGTDPCTLVFENDWGWTDTTWLNYLVSMLNYEGSLNSPKKLMVGLDSIDNLTNPDTVAATAVANNMAFGNEGLEASDITNYPMCSGDWCNLFNMYTGKEPLELQPIALSSPEGDPPVGSLVTLLPFVTSHHVTILEMYTDDWLLAFDPNYPGYSTYGAAYAAAFKAAAMGK